MDFGSVSNGQQLTIVCSLKIFDAEQSAHLMVDTNGCTFLFEGLVSDEFQSFTILNGVLRQQFPVTMVSSTKDTVIMGHHRPSWDSLLSSIDLCSGFGGLAQGALASGFSIQVAVDQNPKMLELYSKASDAHVICGDIGSDDVLCQIWRHSGGAATVTSGFSCQPFSRLGDERSKDDLRSNCLTKTLRTAFLLQAQLIVLECVSPAAHDAFVKGELDHFVKCTGFHCRQVELKLDHIWPCRRHRAWWVISAPDLGPIELSPWPMFQNVQQVQHVIPRVRLWAHEDELSLALDKIEMQAFGVNDELHAKYLLNEKSKAPCALHAWGSQTRACPCGCRQFGFTQERLESKGLHGCLVRSAIFPNGSTVIRHLHPNEVMGLNTFDPVIDFGTDVRLTLSAAGQLACPAQALWILSSILERIDAMKHMPTFSPGAQVQAYRSWLLMRCRLVWPTDDEIIEDQKLLEMIAFWDEFKHLSLAELLFPPKWEGKIEGTISIAAVLDSLIRAKEANCQTVPDSIDMHDDAETPIFDSPAIVDDIETVGCMCVDSCTVLFKGLTEAPLNFQPKCGATIREFVTAHTKLVGEFGIARITMNNRVLGLDHVMEVGQLITIEVQHPSVSPCLRVEQGVCVSPTAEWTQPAIEEEDGALPPRKVSKFDVGECTVPSMVLPDDQNWLDASALHGLQDQQFLKLQMPCIQNAQQLWSLRHQYVRTQDRIAILECQGPFWADDELRFHMNAVVQSYQAAQTKSGRVPSEVCMIDPLVFSAWIQNRGFAPHCWANDHPEIRHKNIPIVTVALLGRHWVPIFMSPLNGILQVHTWDGMGASHEGLDPVLQSLAVALGFQHALVLREHRLFFTSELCGALAIAFLRYALMGTQLPTDCTEATVIHSRLKDIFTQEIRRCQIARRPWVWGAGDQPASSSSSASDLHLAVNITRDQRIDLINHKGFAMADDEIRFHIMDLVSKQPTVPGFPGDLKFTTMEPLIFNCWDSIGQIIANQWSSKNPQIREHGQNVVTAVAVDNHWLPIWMVPEGDSLQIHTFQSEVDFNVVEGVCAILASQLGFGNHAFHRIPGGLPEHVMCGAHAMAFLAHVIMRMPLPLDLHELRTLHTNMRASFVAHLYAIAYTPKPVVWGNGTPRGIRATPENAR